MKCNKCVLAAVLIAVIAFAIIFLQMQKQPAQILEKKPVTFSLFQDSKSYSKGSVIIENVDLPLDASEACTAAKQACDSAECLETKNIAEISGEISEINKENFGNFSWVVELKPVCGPTTAFISESDLTVVCFCAYE